MHARALAAALPDCVGVSELTGVGHMAPVEAPEAVTARIRGLVTTYATRYATTGRDELEEAGA